MNANYITVVFLAGLFCLAPLAVYLLWLALLNRRDRPTVISGPWDFAALVAGLSGFVLFGGGLVLSLLQSNFRYWMRGNFESLRAAWAQEGLMWLLLSLGYLLLVIGCVLLALASRRRSLVVYNVEPAEFETALTEVFEQLNKPVERKGNRWVCGVPLFELDRFERGQTVTLRWLSDDRLLFQDVERLLREAVGNLAPGDENTGRWLMACAGGAGFVAVFSFGLLMVYAFSR